MRKRIIDYSTVSLQPDSAQRWLDLEGTATIEVTSEDPAFPIESALTAMKGPGWRAAEIGEQAVRIVFDYSRQVRRIRLEFSETERQRTQEFTLRWSPASGPLQEIVRQQWNF